MYLILSYLWHCGLERGGVQIVVPPDPGPTTARLSVAVHPIFAAFLFNAYFIFVVVVVHFVVAERVHVPHSAAVHPQVQPFPLGEIRKPSKQTTRFRIAFRLFLPRDTRRFAFGQYRKAFAIAIHFAHILYYYFFFVRRQGRDTTDEIIYNDRVPGLR